MTTMNIASFMAWMFNPLHGKKIELLDAGAGIGSLSLAFAFRGPTEGVKSVRIQAWEVDPMLHQGLNVTLNDCKDLYRDEGIPLTLQIHAEDFIKAVAPGITTGEGPKFTHAILNPPYKKISSDSEHRTMLSAAGVETSNLYSAFVALALLSLVEGGELVAITPRSFCNGKYFKPFRQLLLNHAAITKVHLFEVRNEAFGGDDVLQENVIFHLVKGAQQGDVEISSSRDSSFAPVSRRVVPFLDVVAENDPEKFINLVVEGSDPSIKAGMRKYPHTLQDLGLAVSTGPVVDFRLREHLCQYGQAAVVPLIYSRHFSGGFISHPKPSLKKPDGLMLNDKTAKWLMPSGHYVLVRRLSFKEDRRRIVPAVFDPDRVPCSVVGFENHLNVIHSDKHGLPPALAKGLAVYLGSNLADTWLRRFSGHTQVNAGDLRMLRYPSLEVLTGWGNLVGDDLPSQEEIDVMVDLGTAA